MSQVSSADFLQHLVAGELESSDPATNVVFLGPHARSSESPVFEIPAGRGSAPKFFYLEYQSPRKARVPGGLEDEFLDLETSRTQQDSASKTQADSYADGPFVTPTTAPRSPMYHRSQFLATRDSIHVMVLKLKGKRFIVSTPVEFARALDRIAKAKSD